jgi:hypothetical protein
VTTQCYANLNREGGDSSYDRLGLFQHKTIPFIPRTCWFVANSDCQVKEVNTIAITNFVTIKINPCYSVVATCYIRNSKVVLSSSRIGGTPCPGCCPLLWYKSRCLLAVLRKTIAVVFFSSAKASLIYRQRLSSMTDGFDVKISLLDYRYSSLPANALENDS